jgi:hypothetical protein
MNNKSSIREELIKDVRDFCERNNITTTEFGIRSCRDGSIFGRLTAGKLSLKRIERMQDYMLANDVKKNRGVSIDELID